MRHAAAGAPLPEATPYSVGLGMAFAVLFSAAAACLGLKIGQVFEAAIPIAILAVGLKDWTAGVPSELLGYALFALLCAYIVWATLRRR